MKKYLIQFLYNASILYYKAYNMLILLTVNAIDLTLLQSCSLQYSLYLHTIFGAFIFTKAAPSMMLAFTKGA